MRDNCQQVKKAKVVVQKLREWNLGDPASIKMFTGLPIVPYKIGPYCPI